MGTDQPGAAAGRSPTRLAAVVVAAVISGVQSLPAAESDRATPAVTVVQARRMCLNDTIQATGLLVPRHDVLVRPSKDGLQVKDILVQPGDSVTSGQVLAHLRSVDGAKDSGGDVAVNAPTAGVVYSSSAIVGETATVSGEPLFRMAQDGELELSAEAPVNIMNRLAANQSATIEVIGVGQLAGKVRLVSATINQTTQLGDVRLSLGGDRRLRVGTFARGTITIGQQCGPVVPLSAVLYGGIGAVVQVVRDNRIETRQVTIGLINGGNAEIQEGLANGETVVARAGAFVRDGDRVRPLIDPEFVKNH